MDSADLESVPEQLETARVLLTSEAARFRADPALAAAIRADTQGALEMVDRDAPFNRTITDVAVFVLGMVALAMHYSVGLSHRSLRDWGGRGGLVSAGRATAILWRLRHHNLIVAVGPQENGKRVNFIPQPAMTDVYRRRLAILAAAAGRLDPQAAAFAPRLNEEAPFRALMIEFADGTIQAAERPDPTLRTLEQLTHRTHGSQILYCMLKAAYAAGAERPGGRLILSVAEIAHTLGVSPRHVGGFIAAMERAGFLARSGRGSAEATLTPAFTEAFEAYYSIVLAGIAVAVRHAQGGLDRATASSGKV